MRATMKEQHFSNSQLATPPASPLPEGVEEALESRQEEFEQEEVEYEQHEYEQENHEEEGNEGEGENDEEEAYEEEYEEREEEKGLYNWGDVLELVQPGEYYSGYRRMLSYMLQLGCTIRVKYGRDEKTLGCDDYREQVRQRRREEREFTRQWRRQERDFERLPQPPRSQPPPPLVQEYQPALYYYNHTQYCDSPDEPVWDRTEPVTMFVEEQEEDRRWMECRRETLQDMNQKVEFELMHYVALAEKQPQYPQEPLRVSMFHVGSGHLSTSLPGGHGEVSSSSGSQNLPPTAYISDSDKSFPWSDDEEEAEDSAREQGKMSSIERSLRAQAVTALHNPSAMLLHSVFMNETPTRTRLRMFRHLTGQPQPPHEYAPESVQQAYRESGGRPLDDHSHHPHHHTDIHASSSSSSSHAAAASEHYQHHNHHSHGHHHHHHHHMDSSSHVDDDVPMDDEFGPTYFQGALNN